MTLLDNFTVPFEGAASSEREELFLGTLRVWPIISSSGTCDSEHFDLEPLLLLSQPLPVWAAVAAALN